MLAQQADIELVESSPRPEPDGIDMTNLPTRCVRIHDLREAPPMCRVSLFSRGQHHRNRYMVPLNQLPYLVDRWHLAKHCQCVAPLCRTVVAGVSEHALSCD